ncbi:MAG: ABC transporter substrate-binding protein, partial [Nitrospirota bacterium]
MKTKKAVILKSIALATAVIFSLTAYASSTPTAEIKTTVDAIVSAIKDKNLSLPSNREKRRGKIRSLIKEKFDFEEMAKRSLARHWNDRTPEERKEFVSIFSELLEASYISKIESYTNEKITYDKEEIKGEDKYGVVSTTIVTRNVNIPVEYKVMRKDNKWYVYDVVIEGVSFI